jgi:adenylate cyclase
MACVYSKELNWYIVPEVLFAPPSFLVTEILAKRAGDPEMKKAAKRFFSLNPVSLTFLVTVLVLALFVVQVDLFEIVELKTYDFRFLSRGTKSPQPDVVMAVLDEKSLKSEGRWPWPRSKMAKLIDGLSQDGAKVISFDIIFAEPDENSSIRLIRQLQEKMKDSHVENEGLQAFIEESKANADNDAALAQAIKRSKAKVVLGYFFHMSQEDLAYQLEDKDKEDQLQRIAGSRYPIVLVARQDRTADSFVRAYAPQANLPLLAGTTDAAGYFNMIPDKDGVVRSMPLAIRCGKDIYSPLSIQSVWNYLDRPPLMLQAASYGIEGIRMGNLFIPTDENGHMLINYLGPDKTFREYSITDILQGKIPKGTFKNQIVLVGATAIGLYDMRNTPFAAVFPGLEIHATVIDNILEQAFIHKPKWARIFDAMAIVLFALILGILIPRLSAIKGVVLTSGLFVLYIFLTQWLFTHALLWVNMVYPLLGLVLTYTSLTLYRYLTEERERKKIRGAFSHYVSSSVVNEVLKNPEKLKLGGDMKELTVLFSDIRGFTTISEGLSPEQVHLLINEYLTAMTDIVFKHGGTLDKYMGDAIMAIYGAPVDQPDHAQKACDTALEMMQALKELNAGWAGEGKPVLDIGIGINTGMMMVGNMGSEQRFEYTVLGDAVNLGSRLEGANKNYLTHILISEFTYEKVKEQFLCMEMDSVRVKGKTKPVRIYQLMGRKDASASQAETVRYFHQGLGFYKEQKWDKALEAFKTASAMDRGLHAAQLYMERIAALKSSPPPPNWDGVFTMKEK